MKKTKNLLFLLVLLIGIFTFVIPKEVYAIGEPTITSITVKQGNNVLEKEGDYYIADGYEKIYFSYELANVNAYGMGEYIEVWQDLNDMYPRASGWYHVGYESEMYVDFANEYVDYTVKLCDDWNCETVYETRIIKVRFTKVPEMADDVIYYTKVMQNGTELAYDNTIGGFSLNPLRDVTFSVKGENLDPIGNYTLSCANRSKAVYTGLELMNGVDHTCVIADYNEDYLNLFQKLVSYQTDTGYNDGNSTYFVALYLDGDDNSARNYSASIAYANYGEAVLSRIDDDYNGEEWHYLALSKYLNSNDPLKFYVEGYGLENKNYTVTLSIYNGNTQVYTRNETVGGSTLNNGYNAVFSGFDPGTTGGVRYLYRVTIDGVSKQEIVEYVYSSMQINVTKVVQGRDGSPLSVVNGAYVAEGFDNLYLTLSITNYNPNDNIYVRLANGTSTYRPDNEYDIDLDYFEDETTEFTITLCADMDCDEIITFDSVKIKLTHYNQIQNQRVYFYNVTQGGSIIEPNSSGTFTVNNQQIVSMMVKGEDVIEDATYTLELGGYGNGIQVLGSQLLSGVELTGDPRLSGYMSLNLRIGTATLPRVYFDGENYIEEGYDENSQYHYFSFNLTNTYNKSYTATLKYKNYPDIPITMDDETYLEIYPVNTAYHGANKPLMYYLKGTGYEDKNYNVHLIVTLDDDSTFYERDFTVSGNAINSGTNVELTGLTLPLATDIDEIMAGEYGMPTYTFTLTLDDVNDERMVQYNGAGAHLNVSPEVFFQNGKKNLSVFRGFGNSGVYDTNETVFTKYNKIYINFVGYGFEEDTVYNYYVDYGYYTEGANTELTFPNHVTSGTVTGKILNEVGVFVELNNNSHYTHPSYRFYVKKGDEVLAFTAPVIYTTQMATLANVMLNTANRDLYLYSNEYTYVATKSMPIEITVSGLGFDDNEDYDFEYCAVPIYSNGDYGYYGDVCDEVSFNGKDLNDGTVLIDFDDEEDDEDVVGYMFSVYGEGEDYFGQGYFTVTFVESKDVFSDIGSYVIEDASDIIKNIKKHTTATEFKNNLAVTEGGTIKVFDKTGENEVTGQLGTGMQGRLIDEYDRNFMNIGIAVAGDTTGDGNISITDLVKVKKHLLETDELVDVYVAAADVDGETGVSITDLIDMCKDVTGIKELS